MKGNLILLFAILLLLTGCGGPYYYDLHLEPGPVKGETGKILYVEEIESNDAYWRQQIVFRKDPFKIEYYAYRQWAERPGTLIKNAVVRFYRNTPLFLRVIEAYSSIEPDISLKTNIYSLEMVKDNQAWFARLALDLEFSNKRNGKVILLHTFDRKERIRKKNPELMAEKASFILKAELIKAATKLLTVISK